MVGKVADHEYLLVVQCAGVGVDFFIVGQQQGVVTVSYAKTRILLCRSESAHR